MRQITREDIRAAHAAYDKTRCAGWLAATGNRTLTVQQVTLAKGPVEVVRRAEPRPELGCDIHPVGDE